MLALIGRGGPWGWPRFSRSDIPVSRSAQDPSGTKNCDPANTQTKPQVKHCKAAQRSLGKIITNGPSGAQASGTESEGQQRISLCAGASATCRGQLQLDVIDAPVLPGSPSVVLQHFDLLNSSDVLHVNCESVGAALVWREGGWHVSAYGLNEGTTAVRARHARVDTLLEAYVGCRKLILLRACGGPVKNDRHVGIGPSALLVHGAHHDLTDKSLPSVNPCYACTRRRTGRGGCLDLSQCTPRSDRCESARVLSETRAPPRPAQMAPRARPPPCTTRQSASGLVRPFLSSGLVRATHLKNAESPLRMLTTSTDSQNQAG